MFSKDDVQLLNIAIELKVSSLERAKKSATQPEFMELYESQIAKYHALKATVKGVLDAQVASAKK